LPVFTQTRATATRLANFLHNGRISNTPAAPFGEHDYSTTRAVLQAIFTFCVIKRFKFVINVVFKRKV